MKHYDLLICMRCHRYLGRVQDTSHSVETYTNLKTTKLVYSVDRHNNTFIQQMKEIYKGDAHIASRSWKWGAGLFGMLIEAINYFSGVYSFSHFMTIDYDTLFLGPRADSVLLDKITDPTIGLLGCETDSTKWKKMFRSQRGQLESVLGRLPLYVDAWKGAQGGAMLLTQSLLSTFKAKGIFNNAPDIVRRTTIADDHLLPMICRLCGLSMLDISDVAHCKWKIDMDPIMAEKSGILIFHPIKWDKRSEVLETKVRNHFKEVRRKYVHNKKKI